MNHRSAFLKFDNFIDFILLFFNLQNWLSLNSWLIEYIFKIFILFYSVKKGILWILDL